MVIHDVVSEIMNEKDQMAERVRTAWDALQNKLYGKRTAYPNKEFYAFFAVVQAYAKLADCDGQIHRDIASFLSGFRENLSLERQRVPGTILRDADRLETIFFSGFDPDVEILEVMDCQ